MGTALVPALWAGMTSGRLVAVSLVSVGTVRGSAVWQCHARRPMPGSTSTAAIVPVLRARPFCRDVTVVKIHSSWVELKHEIGIGLLRRYAAGWQLGRNPAAWTGTCHVLQQGRERYIQLEDEIHTSRLLRIHIRVRLSLGCHGGRRLIPIRRHIPVLSHGRIRLFRLPSQLGLMPCIVVLFRQQGVVLPDGVHQLFLHLGQHF